jgi:uncharacterized membrane protein SirB2
VESLDERLDEEQVRRLSTTELVRRALDEARLLARAEVLHAKQELREEIRAAKASGILLGAGGVLALSGITILFTAIAMALPIAEWLAAIIVGVVLLLVAGALGLAGVKRLPKKPLARTQERIKQDVTLTREQLQ